MRRTRSRWRRPRMRIRSRQSADRAHPTFGMSVRVRSLNGRTDHLDPLGVIHCPSDLKVGRTTAGRQVPLAASPRGYLPLVLLLAEPHLDFLLFVVGGLVGVQLERSVVGVGLRAADEAARVEALRQHDVQLGAEQHDLRLEVEPEEDRDHGREASVCALGLAQIARDDQRRDQLQYEERAAREQRSRQNLAERDVPPREHPERDYEEADVERERDQIAGEAAVPAEVDPGVASGHIAGHDRRSDEPETNGAEREETTPNLLDETRPVTARDFPDLVERLLRHAHDCQASPKGGETAEEDRPPRAGEAADRARMKQREGRGHPPKHVRAPVRRQHVAQDRHEHEEEREDREEGPEGDHAREARRLILTVLLDRRRRDRQLLMTLLRPIDPPKLFLDRHPDLLGSEARRRARRCYERQFPRRGYTNLLTDPWVG